MARVTVEDCLEHVDNRFDLVLLATKRARQIVNGVEPLLPWEKDKPTVMALREIAEGLVTDETMNPPEPEVDIMISETEAEVERGDISAISAEPNEETDPHRLS